MIDLKTYNYFKNTLEESMSQEFRLKNIDVKINDFLKETEQNELISKTHKKARPTLNFIEHFLILVSAITGSILISVFAAFSGIFIGNTRSARD